MSDENNRLDLNNFWNLTKSQKISRSSYIINMIVEKIDNNQRIRRLMRYNTINPLAMKSKTSSGKVINQPNLLDSLTVSTKEGLSEDDIKNGISNDKNLYSKAFNPDMSLQKQNYIFIENNHNSYNGNMASMYFRIHLIISDLYSDIKDINKDNELPMTIERNKAIACLIDDMLDKYTVDDKYTDLVGNISFELTDLNEERLTKTNDMVLLTLSYKTKTLGLRIDK